MKERQESGRERRGETCSKGCRERDSSLSGLSFLEFASAQNGYKNIGITSNMQEESKKIVKIIVKITQMQNIFWDK